eukprot:TRINITY_DN27320_c0_g1_i1.p1 TRINITY_DN27320_c0_g1~~TRINITY_DN27320_c0_g1_i1.p1  ORF type:complete len:359 (+),score=69.79 TRINITY_DN27320_c0_g1_i1:131-1078(+)
MASARRAAHGSGSELMAAASLSEHRTFHRRLSVQSRARAWLWRRSARTSCHGLLAAVVAAALAMSSDLISWPMPVAGSLPRTPAGLAEAWKILGLPPGSSAEDRKKAKKKLMRKVHPDLVKDDGTQLQRVLDAFELLENPHTVFDGKPVEPGSAVDRNMGSDGFLRTNRPGDWSSPEAQRKLRQIIEEEERAKKASSQQAQGWPEMPSWMKPPPSSQAPPPPPTRRKYIPTGCKEWYRALTNIRVRAEPDEGSSATGAVIREGEVVEVSGELLLDSPFLGGMKKQKFLQLKSPAGWIFLNGVSGDWAGRQILAKA